ncbi:MAG: AarF/ABC1/UbiB kinase family protein [Clostridia bacterium]|nr:AarF/ABC1/UbiB kinase family protein [Clostridia bacterium]
MVLRTRYRHLARLKEVINTLAKHGLAHLVDYTGWGQGIWRPMKRETEEGFQSTPAQRLRIALEELGPTFVKLGQLLSTRPDLLPSEYIEQFERLQDQVQPVPFEEIIKVLEAEVGLSYDQFFFHLDHQPLASASIGQVHRGTLQSGEDVVVKIQRPGIEQIIKTDLEILFDLARLVEARTKWGKFYKVMDMAEEFARAIREETDYTIEGRNADRLAANFAHDKLVVIPKVIWEHSGSKVLVMEYVESVKINDFAALEKADYNKEQIARNLANGLFKQIYIHGFFHADPHPGNLGVLPRERILFMDFGMMGRIDEDLKDKFVLMVLAVVRQDVNSIVELLLAIGKAHGKVNRGQLKKDIGNLMHRYYNLPLSELRIGDILNEMFSMAFKYQIRVPVEVTLVAKTLVTLEGILPQLDPKISILELAEPFGKVLVKNRYSPTKLKKLFISNIAELLGFFNHLPRRWDNIMTIIEEGELKIELEHRNLNKFLLRMNIISNRLAFSIIIGSLVIGSALIAKDNANSLLWKFPVAELGFMVAVVMGLWLLISILRSGRI